MVDMNMRFLAGPGEMASLTRAKDWHNTPVGEPTKWPQSLRTSLSIILNSKFPMFLWWGPQLVCFYNDAYRPSLGKNGKHPSILGTPAADAWVEIWDIIKPLIDQVLSGGDAIRRENQLIPVYRDGKIEDVYWTFCYSPVYDESGVISGVLVTCSETTDAGLNLRKLEDSNRNYFDNIMQAPMAMCVFRGKDFVVELANDLMLEIWGKNANEVLNRPIFAGLPEARGQGLELLLANVYHTGEKFIANERPVDLPRNGGIQTAYISLVYQPLKEVNGTISGIVATALDVSPQVMARKKLEASEEKFRLLADSMPQHIWTTDPNGNLNYFNHSFYHYSGLSQDQLTQNGWLQIVHPNDREKSITAWLDSLHTGKDFNFEHRFKKHDGMYRWQLSRAIPQRDSQGNIQMWVGTSTDIQDHKSFAAELEMKVEERTVQLKQLNEELVKSEERYHLMVEEVQDYAILYLNHDGIVENWNKGAEKIKGYQASEIIGRSFSVFYTASDREDGLPERLLSRAETKGKAKQEGWRVRKDGSLFWASVVITAVHGDSDRVIGFSKVTHDLTEKKEADDKLRLNSQQLEQKNKELEKMNAELQSFAYVSSHDLQEPLRKIQTFASRITETEGDKLSDTARDYFWRMKDAANRMQALIQDLLMYSRTNTIDRIFKLTDLNAVLNEVKYDFKETITEKHAVIESTHMCVVKVIPFQFRQLLNNLIGNALKFSRNDIPPVIRITSEILIPGQAIPGSFPSEKQVCHIRISDNGIGFDPSYKERIFEVFQRLHGRDKYSGTGIGLAIVKKIVENHSGLITASSETDKGATFDIYIPFAD